MISLPFRLLVASTIAAWCLPGLRSPGAEPPIAAPTGVRMVAGSIEGANFSMAVPDPWNRNVLVYAHGYRPDAAPLHADLTLEDPAYARLLGDGWMIAATSFRRNGIIIRDAIADIGALRDHIEQTEGIPGIVILVGESMGGTIVTLIAENEPGRFHGAVAIGAALHARDERYPLALTREPKMPVLFLSNQSEATGPQAYAHAAMNAPVPPALWTVARSGHVNVNHEERALAIDGLITWITTNRIDRTRDATVSLAAGPSTARVSHGAIHGAVGSITDTYGNIFTTFRPADLVAAGVKKGADFELEAGGTTFRVHYGSDFSDVPHGAWIAFDRAEGVVLIARNYENAASTAGVSAGDALTIRSIPGEGNRKE